MSMRSAYILSLSFAFALAGGCRSSKAPATMPTTGPTTTTRPTATDIDPRTATSVYWLEREAVARVSSSNYDQLMEACEHVLRQRFFEPARIHHRAGLVESRPLVSQQAWEFWRSDVGDTTGLIRSTLASYRRTLYWKVSANTDGTFTAEPRVLIERVDSGAASASPPS